MSIVQRITNLFRRSTLDQEIEAELRSHIEMRTADNIAAGMSPEEARRQAVLRFGSRVGMKERVIAVDAHMFLDSLWQDLCYGLRMLRKSPGFTAVAVLTLALGIGANTAIFSLIDAILLRDLPVHDPGQLVEVMPANKNGDNAFMSLPTLEELDRRQQVFSDMFGWWGDAVVNAEIHGALQRVDLYAVDGRFYSELGASPYLGRLILPGDVNLHSGAPAQVAVLGYNFWRNQFSADPAVIGKTIRIENLPFEIIGVSADGFTGMSASIEPEITIPLTAEPLIAGVPLAHLYDRKTRLLDVTARLGDGVTFKQAVAQLQALWPSVRADTVPPDYSVVQRQEFLSYNLDVKRAGKGFTVLHKQFVEPLYVLMGIAGLVLLIACVNLASLVMSRAAARSHEMAVRLALGAGRGRLVRQVLTEALMLSLAGAALGLLLACWGSEALSHFILSQIFVIPAQLKLTPDGHILAFTI